MSIRTIPPAAAALAALAALALALALPAAASAKAIETAAVCGAHGCKEVAVKGDPHLLMGGGSPGADLTEAAPYYRFEIGIGDGTGEVFDTFAIDYVPSAGKLRGEDGLWMDALPSTARAMDAAARGVIPIPAAELDVGRMKVTESRGGAEPLPPEIVSAPAPPGDTGMAAWVIALMAAGGLGVMLGSARLLLRRRPGAGPRAVAAP